MPESQPKFYLTTPIYYVNARPHIGHAYTTIVADVIARRHRMLGDDTWFLTGTDEHGQKIERSAAAAGIEPQQFADQVSASFRGLWDRMGLTYDQYIRTTDEAHKRGVQKLFTVLKDRGFIYLSSYTGQYCVSEEMFVEGPPGTIGPDGRPTETVTEENYFFKLSAFQRPLIDLIEADTLLIQPEARKNEVLGFLRGNVPAARSSEDANASSTAPSSESGHSQSQPPSSSESPNSGVAYSNAGKPYVPGVLKDLSISRSSFKWGIPVPGDEKHVIYVWLDALANYMTAVGYGSDDPADMAKFERYWPADLHIIGKEIVRFHCVYWPAFLLAADLPLPKQIVAHGWLLFEESKMSKSRGNIVRTETILNAFGTLCPPQAQSTLESPLPGLSSRSEAEGSAVPLPLPEPTQHDRDLFAADVLRYFLLREIPFGQDGSFSFDALVQRYNSDLANGYGNLVSRTLGLIQQNYSNDIPEDHLTGAVSDASDPLALAIAGSLFPIRSSFTKLIGFLDPWSILKFEEVLGDIETKVARTDGMLTATTPWKLAKLDGDQARTGLGAVLYTAAESIRIITALLHPILPYATARVWAQLGLGDIEEAARSGELKNLQWGGLKPGTKLGPLSPIFPRADKGLAQIMTDMEASTTAAQNAATAPRTTEAPPADPTDPAAGPRTSTLAEPNPIAQVAGAAAALPDLPKTPSHTEAPASGAFATDAAASEIPDTPIISIDDFVKIDLRVAQIIVAERIPKADKLLRLEVDLGYEQRQILSGIAEWYTPEELIGRKIVIIANLAPRKMRGLESKGMLLAASHGEGGKPILATFGEDIAIGSRLR